MHGASSAPKGNHSRRELAACLLLCCPFVACGGPQEPAASAEPAAQAVEPGEPAADQGLEAESSDSAAAADAPAAGEDAADLAPSAEDPNEIRDVVYKMTRDGLEIEVDGVLFRPQAEPVKVQGGAWGVRVKLEAEGVGDRTRHLLKPKGGPLAFAGSV